MANFAYNVDNATSGPAVHHVFTTFRPAHGVSLHPHQRSGEVSADSHDLVGAQAAYQRPGGLGGSAYPAGHADLTIPPSLPISQGNATRNPGNMI